MNYKIKLRDISCFILDVDGVLTNGSILINGNDYQRSINVKDSYALQYAAKMGYKIFIITGGESLTIKKTYLKLGVTEVYLESSDKLSVFKNLIGEYKIDANTVLYMGDDIPDIPLLHEVGLSASPADACVDVKQIVDYVSPLGGGMGCVRDLIEQTMRVQGKWLSEKAYQW